MSGKAEHPPLILLGGLDGALAILRSFARKNVPVVVIAAQESPALRSRFCKRSFLTPQKVEEKAPFWKEVLLGGKHPDLHGSVLFPCGDAEVAFLGANRPELEQHYILDDSVPSIHKSMLDKLRTLQLAKAAGCPTPGFWEVNRVEDLEAIRQEMAFPMIIKPVESHALFRRLYMRKLFPVDSYSELVARISDTQTHGIRMLLCELVPGLDSEITSSYYSYYDRNGEQLFRFTKRVLRRYPLLGGYAAYHTTQWLPETAEMGECFFRAIGFRGLGNIEFKRDARDGQLKIIECNGRFTDAHELLVRCGMDTAWLIYCKLTGRPVPRIESYEEDVGLWYPVRDVKAFLKLRSQGDLSTRQWLRSVSGKKAFPYFQLSDPWPSISRGLERLGLDARP